MHFHVNLCAFASFTKCLVRHTNIYYFQFAHEMQIYRSIEKGERRAKKNDVRWQKAVYCYLSTCQSGRTKNRRIIEPFNVIVRNKKNRSIEQAQSERTEIWVILFYRKMTQNSPTEKKRITIWMKCHFICEYSINGATWYVRFTFNQCDEEGAKNCWFWM